jgi:hypothetical protein
MPSFAPMSLKISNKFRPVFYAASWSSTGLELTDSVQKSKEHMKKYDKYVIIFK